MNETSGRTPITRLQTRQQLKSNWTNTSVKQERLALLALALPIHAQRTAETRLHEAQPTCVRVCVSVRALVCWHIQDGRAVKQCSLRVRGRQLYSVAWPNNMPVTLSLTERERGVFFCVCRAGNRLLLLLWWTAVRYFCCSCFCLLRSSASFNNLSAARLSALDAHT